MKKQKLVKYFAVLCITLLIAVFLIGQFIYRQQISNEFYTSAIPNDPVRLGMKPYDVKSALGKPDKKTVVKDIVATGYGNEIVWGKTGEIILKYNMQISDGNASVDYSYYKKDGRITHAWAHISNYETLDEATAALDELVRYAETVFEQKGDYAFEVLESSYDSHLTYRFVAKNQDHKFRYEASIGNSNENGIYRDKPYYINIYQSLFRNKDG